MPGRGHRKRILPQAVLLKKGMTLDQIGQGARRHHVVVNYLRRSLGQELGGHISPLAAYDANTDRFLVLDVSRYKYPPVWVKTADLYAAMDTVDADNERRRRGFVLIGKEP